MIKKFLVVTVLTCAISMGAYAQRDSLSVSQRLAKLEADNYEAGAQLRKFHNHYSDGIAVSVAGVVLTGVGTAMSFEYDRTLSRVLLISGSALSLTGAVLTIASFNKIKHAGIRLQGNTLSVRLGKRR